MFLNILAVVNKDIEQMISHFARKYTLSYVEATKVTLRPLGEKLMSPENAFLVSSAVFLL